MQGVSGRDGMEVRGYQLQTIIYGMGGYQGLTVEHRELYSVYSDKP